MNSKTSLAELSTKEILTAIKAAIKSVRDGSRPRSDHRIAAMWGIQCLEHELTEAIERNSKATLEKMFGKAGKV